MFKKLFFAIKSFYFKLNGIYSELCRIADSLEKVNTCDYYYVVEFSYEDCTSTSDPLLTLKAVNDFINFVVLVRRPTSIRILKNFDNGR